MIEPEGVYNGLARYAFTNITEEEFVSHWDGQPWIVPAGQTVELPEYMAVKMTKELVDKIMIGEVKLAEDNYYKANPGAAPNSFRAPNQMGVPAARKVWEDKIVRQMEIDEESPQMAIERAKIRSEMEAQFKRDAQPGKVDMPASVEEFADLDKSRQAPKQAKAPAAVKKL